MPQKEYPHICFHLVLTIKILLYFGGNIYCSHRKDGLSQLCSICIDNLLTTCGSQTCSSQCHGSVNQSRRHLFSCLCDNACKRSLAICRKSRASCPVSRLLSVPIWPACAKQERQHDSINQPINQSINQ